MSWYYADQGRQKGPVEVAALLESLLAAGEPASVPVWREGLAAWTPAGAVPELASEIQAALAFFYEGPGGSLGPVPPARLAEMLRSGQVPPHTLVWRRGFAEWRPASSVPDLGAAAGVPAAQPGRAAAVLFASAPPAADDDRAWSNGAQVVTERQAELPDRCFKCNAPAGGYRKKIALRWHPAGWYLLVLVNILVYAIVASFVSKKADLRVGLCPGHRTRHRNMVLAAWAAVLGPLVLTGVGIGMESGGAVVTGLGLFLAGIVFAVVATRIATPARVDEHFAHVKGAGPAFVDSLPRWEGYRIWMR